VACGTRGHGKFPNLSKHGVHPSATKLGISGHDGGGDMRTGPNMGCRVAPLNKQSSGHDGGGDVENLPNRSKHGVAYIVA
jgi:hypothetical protein